MPYYLQHGETRITINIEGNKMKNYTFKKPKEYTDLKPVATLIIITSSSYKWACLLINKLGPGWVYVGEEPCDE